MELRCLSAIVALAVSATARGQVTPEAAALAYKSSAFASFSQDFFARFSRDPGAAAQTGEIQLDREWHIVVPADAAIFTNHPGLRGAEIVRHVDQPPIGYIPCTEPAAASARQAAPRKAHPPSHDSALNQPCE